MNRFFFRLVGFLLIIGSLLGLILSVWGLVYLWQTRTAVTTTITNNIALVNRSLHATSDGLKVVNASLDSAKTNLGIIQNSTRQMAITLSDTNPTLLATGDMMGNELPMIIINTRRSLLVAQDSARLIDDTLRVISAIPLIGARYKPDVPLQTSIADVSESLRDLPISFMKIKEGIDKAASNLNTIQGSVNQLVSELDKVNASLSDAQKVNNQYIQIVDQLIPQLDLIEQRLPVWLRNFYIVATLALAWLIITQIAIFTQGIDWLTKRSS